ncbi:hypothetical protein SLS62_000364 [Diatrype stigma]|uniref:Uncharacterized protein n=1 Tax=Diatrype stigma TaxID=117547 RepID=A0AAN9YWM7_9PEZI
MANPNYAEPATFSLSQDPPDKTIDLGRNGVSISTDAQGRILQLSAFHPEHGIMVAVPFEQFDGNKFRDPSYVRKYRTRMLQYMKTSKGGFGLDLKGDVDFVSIRRIGSHTACFEYTFVNGLEVTYTINVLGNGSVIQTAELTNKSSEIITQKIDLNLCLSLNRASYGQLTEGGPIPLPKSCNIFITTDYQTFSVTNPYLGALIEADVELDDKPLKLESPKDQKVDNSPLDVRASTSVGIHPGQTVKVKAKIRLTPGIEPQSRGNGWARFKAHVSLQEPETLEWKDEEKLTTWQIRLLLEAYKKLGLLFEPNSASYKYYQQQIRKIAKGHLHWVFNRAERPEKFWRRSYVVTGKPKDQSTFQLDQQCYPFLELCDYLDVFPDDEDVKRLADSAAITEVLEYLETQRDAETGLYPTDETPADDSVTYPYHFSSHVLLWRTYTRLRDLWARIKPADAAEIQRLGSLATRIRDQTLAAFTSRHPAIGKPMFAYGTSGGGGGGGGGSNATEEFYYDGNDVPTLFAEEWGFVQTAAEAAAWRNTMEFGLSPANADGYCKGRYPGLGSRHSPGAWVLGYFQEMAYATRTSSNNNNNTGAGTGRKEGEGQGDLKRAWTKITAAMQWDGTFSEAVDPDTAKCSSKAWFSWPGSMIGALLIQMTAEGKLGDLL